MKIDNSRKIIVGDFEPEDQDLVETIANSLNPFMEQVTEVLTNRIDFQNLNQELVQFKVRVDASGKPVNVLSLAAKKLDRAVGSIIINVYTRSVFPIQAPFMAIEPFGVNTYKIKYITGLLPDVEYEIVAILIGRDL